MKTEKETIQAPKPKSIMSKNVTQFRHFLKHSHITQNDIDWAINLRSYNLCSKISKEASTPQVYYKSTKLQQIRNKISKDQHNDKNKFILNFGQFSQLAKQSSISKDNMLYHISLGNGSAKCSPNQIGDRFQTLPKKDRHEEPTFLKADCVKKVRKITNQNLESAFDGSQNFPAYTQKILKQRNIMNLQHLVKGRNSLPNIAWHVGLRNYS